VSAPTQKWVTLGRVSGVFGVKGWVKIQSYTEPRGNIVTFGVWTLRLRGADQAFDVEDGHGDAGSVAAKLRGIEQLLDKIPGRKSGQLAAAKFDPKLFRRQIGIIDSMTPVERRNPDRIDGSRKRRIAAGAGLPIQDVSRLLKQHKQLAQTMKQLSKGGGMQRLLGGLRRGGGGPPVLRGRR